MITEEVVVTMMAEATMNDMIEDMMFITLVAQDIRGAAEVEVNIELLESFCPSCGLTARLGCEPHAYNLL